ncbi:MAG: ribonucleoside triphosphate reductase, partial [Firmicutes bacterium]|nr:ribonucleoside triphosphate reductase [Bacillota bacterium]
LNVPTRVGFQTPFVNLTFDVNPPVPMKGEPVIVGGKRQDTVYGDYQEEMDLLNMAFCEVMTEGDAKGRIFTFPIPTYNITPDFPWGTPVADRIMAMTAKYGIPYFANFLNSDLKPEDVRSMCCRLRLDVRELKRRGGGLFGANPLTGSIGVVTINLPRLGYLAKDEGEFLTLLGEKMDLAKESLVLKRKVLEQFTEQGLYPYSRFYLRHVKEGFGGYWENHFNTIGIVGMHEAALNLLGEGIETDTGHSFAVRVLDYMRARMQDYQEELGRLFNLEATPAEGTSYRLARLDKEAYPDIITAGDREPYYTNSTQLPVNHGLDLFTALENQNDLQQKYTGGTVFHAFLGERITDVRTAAEVVKTVFSNFRLPYFSLTPTFSVCPEHGYLTGEQPLCPQCGRETEIWSRVVGYYRPVKNWNKGKKEEFRERCTFQVEVDRVAQTQVAAGSE